MDETISHYARYAVAALEAAGGGLIVLAAVYATVAATVLLLRGAAGREVFSSFRRKLGHGILLGLEFLVAADIVNTIAVEFTVRSVGTLTIVVLVRTFLSFALEVEMTGRWPWQQQPGSGRPAGSSGRHGGRR